MRLAGGHRWAQAREDERSRRWPEAIRLQTRHMERKTLLLIDDSKTARARVRQVLETHAVFTDVIEATNGLEGFKALLSHPVDVILCDLIMPEMDGFKFLDMKRSKPEFDDVPVILLTAQGEIRNKIQGLERGASDYLVKPFDDGELLARVKVQLKIKTLQDELRAANEHLRELSNRDFLTGLFNRRYLMSELEKEFYRAKRMGRDLSVLMIDIDYFKRCNDTYGHKVGDQVLVKVAQTIGDQLRRFDLLARYGGEEFIIALPETGSAGAEQVAERYRRNVESLRVAADDRIISVTISIGVATYSEANYDNLDELIEAADAKLYEAKAAGRNRVMVAA